MSVRSRSPAPKLHRSSAVRCAHSSASLARPSWGSTGVADAPQFVEVQARRTDGAELLFGRKSVSGWLRRSRRRKQPQATAQPAKGSQHRKNTDRDPSAIPRPSLHRSEDRRRSEGAGDHQYPLQHDPADASCTADLTHRRIASRVHPSQPRHDDPGHPRRGSGRCCWNWPPSTRGRATRGPSRLTLPGAGPLTHADCAAAIEFVFLILRPFRPRLQHVKRLAQLLAISAGMVLVAVCLMAILVMLVHFGLGPLAADSVND